MNREQAFETLSELDDRFIAEAIRYAPGDASKPPERIVQMKKRKILAIALAAALILALGAAAYALSGIPRSTGTHLMPKEADYESLAALEKVEKDVGYPVTAPAAFSNGYAFDGLHVVGQAVYGESNEVLHEYYGVSVTYAKPDAQKLYLDVNPILQLEGGHAAPAPNEERMIGGVTVGLSRDHYKFVPPDYEKTEDDLAREAAGHYYISFGADGIEERDMAFADFEIDGVNYTLMDMYASEDSFDTLAQMAKEILEAAKK